MDSSGFASRRAGGGRSHVGSAFDVVEPDDSRRPCGDRSSVRGPRRDQGPVSLDTTSATGVAEIRRSFALFPDSVTCLLPLIGVVHYLQSLIDADPPTCCSLHASYSPSLSLRVAFSRAPLVGRAAGAVREASRGARASATEHPRAYRDLLYSFSASTIRFTRSER